MHLMAYSRSREGTLQYLDIQKYFSSTTIDKRLSTLLWEGSLLT
jgi:hypothetical protein